MHRAAALLMGCVLAGTACDSRSASDAGVPPDARLDDAETRRDAAVPDGAAPDGGRVIVPTDECPGIPLETDGALELEVRSFVLQGEVRVGGEPLPEGGERGSLVLRSEEEAITLSLGSTGPARYRAVVVAGDYELHYAPAGCASASPMPCNGGHLMDVSVRSDGVLDVDIPVVTMRGTVRIDSAIVPAQGTALRIGDASVSWDATGAYVTRLLPGSYSIELVPGAPDCASESNALPCEGGVVRDAVELVSDGVLDLDIATARVRGRVTADGETVDRPGVLRFEGGAGSMTVPFDATGAYLTRVLPGPHTIRFEGTGTCGTGSLPCNAATLIEDVALATDGVLDLDVPSARVSGLVRLNGGPVPGPGSLTFGDATVAFDASGAYALAIAPGVYDVGVVGGCAPPSRFPCNDGVVRASVTLAADGVLDVDVASVSVDGRVRVGGAEPGEAGVLTFSGADVGEATASFGEDGVYALSLLRGRYDVAFAPASPCAEGGLLPCHAGTAVRGAELSSDGVLDVALEAVDISARLQVGGAAPAPGSAGRVRLSREGASVEVDLGSSTHELRLAPGAWDVDFIAGGCAGNTPCTPGRVHRGVALTADGALDIDIPVVSVAVALRLDGTVEDPPRPLAFIKLATSDDPVGGRAEWTGGPLRLFPGLYLVDYEGGTTVCDGTDGPCLRASLAGCEEDP